MFYDEDDVDTDLGSAEFEDSFIDEEEDTTVFDKKRAPGPVSGASFVLDPWPKTAFILIVIGFGFDLLTPPAIWSVYVYWLVMNYALLVLVAVAAVQSIKIWVLGAGSRLRWGGITNLALVVGSGVLGTLDTISWLGFGSSIVPGYDSSLLLLSAVLVIFSLYTLFLIQRTFNSGAAD
jgi:hypothetical protein